MIEVIISALCIYAVSALLVNYEGPFGIFERIRSVKALQGVTSCQVCTAFYVTIPFLFIIEPIQALAAYGLVIVVVRYEP